MYPEEKIPVASGAIGLQFNALTTWPPFQHVKENRSAHLEHTIFKDQELLIHAFQPGSVI